MNLSDQPRLAIPASSFGREAVLPLRLLFRDPLNVRKKSGSEVDELAALIYAQTLLQNLVVREELDDDHEHTGRYGVVAGGRRLDAMFLLYTQQKIDEDYPVRVLVVSQDEAIAVSLAENSGRMSLCPADQFEAFKALVQGGKTIAQVADAFGVTPVTVQRRLKLADVAPSLIALYRDDEISLEQMMALALVDDHATQERVWNNTPSYHRSPDELRVLLTERDIETSDRRARFVGLEAYEKAGGAVRRDLFSDGDKGCTLRDAALLERLALEALERHAQPLRDEGVPWVEVRTRFDQHSAERYQQFTFCRMVTRDPTPEERAQMDALEEEVDRLGAEWDALGEDVDDGAIREQHDAAETRLDAIKASLRSVDPRDSAIAGAIVYLDHAGRVAVERGLVRKAQRGEAARADGAHDGDDDSDDRASDDRANDDDGDETGEGGRLVAGSRPGKAAHKPEFSEKLYRQLTAHRTAAIRASLADSPTVALRVIAYQLAVPVFCDDYERLDAPVEVRADRAALEQAAPDYEGSIAQQQLDAHRRRLGDRLPGDRTALLSWLLAADDTTVLDVLAYCVACCFNAVRGDANATPLTDTVAAALQLDLVDWWAPTRQSYLALVSKAKILEAVTEAVSVEAAVPLAAMKKDALVAAAERELDGKGWLPRPLRAPAAPPHGA
jgi:ParB family chromosome partitioning protein